MITGGRLTGSIVLSTLVCLCFAATATAAPAPRGGGQVMQLKKGPDLVIREIMVTAVKQGPVGANLEVQVGVLNVGEGQAGGFNLALVYMANLDMDHPYVKIERNEISPIMAGDGLAVSFVIPAHPGTPEQGMLIAIADPPVAGHASGAMTEGRYLMLTALGGGGRWDTNNVFGVIFNVAGHDMPVSWINPATQ